MKLVLTMKRRWWFGAARYALIPAIMLGIVSTKRAAELLAKYAIKFGTTEA